MKKLLYLFISVVMLAQCACAAAPQDIISSDDVVCLAAESEADTKIFTTEYAYVRGGAEWKEKNWHDILKERNRGPMLIMKNGRDGSNVTRLALLRFDISSLALETLGKVELKVKFTDIEKDTDIPFDVFLVDNNWKEDSVTYSTQPKKLNNSAVAKEVVLKDECADVTSAVRTMLQKGENSVTLMLVQAVKSDVETKIEFSKLSEGEMPHLIIGEVENYLPETDETEDTEEIGMRSFYTTEYAYVRGGSNWANKNWRRINDEIGSDELLHIKNSEGSTDVSRRIFFKFDLSGLNVLDVGFAELCVKLSAVEKDMDVHFDIYLVDDNWNGDTVTWATQPKKLNETPVISNVVFGTLARIDITEFVEDMLFEGKVSFSLMLIQTDKTDTVTKINVSASAASAMPHIKVHKEKSTKDEGYVKQLVNDEAENQAIWDRAKQMYDEWYARYLVVKAKPLGTPTLIESEASQFDKTVMSPGSNPSGEYIKRPTRTVDSLTDISKYVDMETPTKFDKYGGIMDNTLRQDPTGFFYTKKMGDRWWVIDPLGYPCQLRCVSGVTVSYQGSPTQKKAVLDKFGTSERWAISTTRHLADDLLFNSASTSDNTIFEVENGLSYFKRFGAMSSYASAQGINVGQGGQSRFSENNTMPVFDPGFEEKVDENAKANAVPDDERMIAYITDNELPMDVNMLINYLTIDPYREINHYSYATAWYWMTQMTGKEEIDAADITPELSDLFRGFVWDRYLYVVKSAITKYDPNHLYAGTKYLNGVKESEWIIRFSAEYIDIFTINWYGAWEPQAEYIYDFEKYGDIPFMVTEFYAKSSDTFDKLASRDGAGFYVKTQAERGLFYQNYTLRLLEAKNCVGWQWFQYTDNDPAGNPTDISSRDCNKGIVNNRHEEYTELADDMAIINKNVYKLIEYFDAKYAK